MFATMLNIANKLGLSCAKLEVTVRMGIPKPPLLDMPSDMILERTADMLLILPQTCHLA